MDRFDHSDLDLATDFAGRGGPRVVPDYALAAVDVPAMSPPMPDDFFEFCRGPGWFDSSWELGRGLDVCEGVAIAARLPEWFSAAGRSLQPLQSL